MNSIDEIKSRLSIEDVIADVVPLKKAGANLKALCPFHQEKTPSFMVSPQKQMWHCFGCNEGGDIFTFIQKYEGIEFREAVQQLAQRAGVVLREFTIPDAGKKKILLDINAAACEYYGEQLKKKTPAADKTREYLALRGLVNESITRWSLGLAPDSWDGLLKYLIAKKFSLRDVVEAGVAVEREGTAYDRFRRRLMFPIRDPQGKVVGFTGRTLATIVFTEEAEGGKYINSPQTPIYNKSQVLYGFDIARRDVKRLNYAVVVEGNMDVILSHQAGTRNVVGVSGTALTPEQLRLLKRYTENIILAFDADAAGSQAIFKGITSAWDLGMNVKVIALKDGKDPAEVVATDPALWRDAIKSSIGVVDFYFDQVLVRVDLTRADHKKQAAEKIMSIISRLKTQVEQAHYIKLLASRLDIPEHVLWTMVTTQPAAKKTNVYTPPQKSKEQLLSEHLISFLATHSSFLPLLVREIEPDMVNERVKSLYKKIIVYYTREHESDLKGISKELTQEELKLWSELVFHGEKLYAELPVPEREQTFRKLVTRIKRDCLSQKLRELTDAIKHAEREGRTNDVRQLIHEYRTMSEQRSKLQE